MIQVIFFVTRVVHLVVRILVSRQIPVTLHIGSSIVHIYYICGQCPDCKQETFPFFGDEIVGAKCEPREGASADSFSCFQICL